MFKWLAPIANQFESYTFKKLCFEYETAASTDTAGSVMMAVDYDARDSAPTTKVDMMSYWGAIRSAAWREFCNVSDKPDLQKMATKRYVRNGPAPTDTDIKTYDVGNLILATSGITPSAGCGLWQTGWKVGDPFPVGELYVDYVVELETPHVAVTLPPPPPSAMQAPPAFVATELATSLPNWADNLGLNASTATVTEWGGLGDGETIVFNLLNQTLDTPQPPYQGLIQVYIDFVAGIVNTNVPALSANSDPAWVDRGCLLSTQNIISGEQQVICLFTTTGPMGLPVGSSINWGLTLPLNWTSITSASVRFATYLDEGPAVSTGYRRFGLDQIPTERTVIKRAVGPKPPTENVDKRSQTLHYSVKDRVDGPRSEGEAPDAERLEKQPTFVGFAAEEKLVKLRAQLKEMQDNFDQWTAVY
jgi:hypothetical protein